MFGRNFSIWGCANNGTECSILLSGNTRKEIVASLEDLYKQGYTFCSPVLRVNNASAPALISYKNVLLIGENINR